MTRFLEYTPHQPELMMAGAPDPEQAGRYRELARRSSPGAIIPEPVPAAPPVVRLTPAQLAIVRARASDRGADVGCILSRRIVQAITATRCGTTTTETAHSACPSTRSDTTSTRK